MASGRYSAGSWAQHSQLLAKVPETSWMHFATLRVPHQNVEHLCPSLFDALKNAYSKPSKLYFGNRTLLFQDGTTRGDPLAMATFGVFILSWIRLLAPNQSTQNWCADVRYAVAKFGLHQRLFSSFKKHSLNFDYELNKCHQVVKPGLKEKAAFFSNEKQVNFIDGHRVL